jgi:hypothetical protein
MSATTDRLREMERQTAPLPWPVHDFHDMPADQFSMLYALTQAWPLLKAEVAELEATVVKLAGENTSLKTERVGLVHNATEATRQLNQSQEKSVRLLAELREQVRVAIEERDKLAARVANLGLANAAAHTVCASIDSARVGSGGAWGHYDGEAHDAWKRAT